MTWRTNPNSAPTRAEQAYALLRADILAGRQPAGAPLPFPELTVRYEASTGVLREALARLVGEGLVATEPQHGFHVMPLSVADLRHLTDARRSIEPLVLGQAIEHGSVAWESEVLAAHHRLERTSHISADDFGQLSDDRAAAHSAYHDALLSGCPNPRLLAIAGSLRDAAEPYSRWAFTLDRSDRDVAREHRAILQAVLANDAGTAIAALTAHIQNTTDVLLKGANTVPGSLMWRSGTQQRHVSGRDRAAKCRRSLSS